SLTPSFGEPWLTSEEGLLLSSVPSTHIRHHSRLPVTTASEGLTPFSGLSVRLHSHSCAHIYTHIHII
ncbi:mCG1046205, partial [Mus musculus]